VDEQQAVEVETEGKRRDISSITFPYLDLDDAVAVAKAIYGNAGDQCTIDQLAAYMKQSTRSSAFKEKVRTARIFGLISDNVKLTPIGHLVVDPQRERLGRAQAFLTVPLYKAVFEKYRGRQLPPDVALEREMIALGVAEKQRAKARQAFQRSAQQAGYFEQGKDRLVAPAGTPTPINQGNAGGNGSIAQRRSGQGGGGFTPPTGLPPRIKMLLRVLPNEGTHWPQDEQDVWLDEMRDAIRKSYLGLESTDDEAPE
jgi:hypothetical protein